MVFEKNFFEYFMKILHCMALNKIQPFGRHVRFFKFELILALMVDLVICKNEKDPIKMKALES